MTLHTSFQNLEQYLNSCIVGQPDLTKKLIIALLCNGHLLVEGTPGLAKTKAIKILSSAIDASEQRIQFTPDLLPSDITGSDVYRPETHSFYFQKGPIFNNLILADEINRAPAKVQSALLEAMGERQITVGNTTYRLPDLFMVMATQNPIEQEGTYMLPEAQLDRFLFYVRIQYPNADAERQILKIVRREERQEPCPEFKKINEKTIFMAREEVSRVYMSPEIEEYIIQFVMATRNPIAYGADIAKYIGYGVSPRGTIALDLCSRGSAWLSGRDYVTPDDVRSIIYDVLRHRILPSFEGKAAGITSEKIIDLLLQRVPMI
ncbi:MAG: MoxR family ATPase [Alphaproteobacteria bacterium]|nr:MoxR family ATPase [Alphaproteobacteria bacterium]